MSESRRSAEHFVCGGIAGMAARTVIAPVERIKIIYQTHGAGKSGQGWLVLIKKVKDESGGGLRTATAFWKGNSVAVIRVFPYLGIQLSSNEFFRRQIHNMCASTSSGRPLLDKKTQHFIAGGGAGMTAVFCTYPLDLARARMAQLMEQGAKQIPSIVGTMKQVVKNEGSLRALYSGAGISMTGAAIYCGIKFSSYDASKDFCRKYLLADTEGPPSALHRAVSGGLAGAFAQTFVYPFDVLRRRLQTGGPEAKEKYRNTVQGFWTLYREEGLVRGLYRGCSLNYIKTIPNTTVYLALFDLLKDHFCQS
eukprot:TRINITY_DN37654_c0_g1_i1.p1 TRINITY_DN37654_c0_g1~~TRINITY_DN37654_c0_g1_i1.p1  ORF type:complete len:329 (-),score=39.62 TRINITY_DN37654_c0_g1_i1:128-1051(-)